MISLLLIFTSSLNLKNSAKSTKHIVSNLRSKSQVFLSPNSFANFWRCHGFVGYFLPTGLDSIRFAAPLAAIKIGDLKRPLKPRML